MVVVLAMGWWAGTVVRVGGCGVAISHSVSISVVSRGFWASVVGGVEVVGSVWECPDSLGLGLGLVQPTGCHLGFAVLLMSVSVVSTVSVLVVRGSGPGAAVLRA